MTTALQSNCDHLVPEGSTGVTGSDWISSSVHQSDYYLTVGIGVNEHGEQSLR